MQSNTPRWPPPRYGEPAAQNHQQPEYAQQGHAPQGSGYYFPQGAREADAGQGYAAGHQQHHQGYAAQAPVQHGSPPFNRQAPGPDAGAGPDYAQAPGQSLPFGRFPQPGAEPEANYGYSGQGAEPAFGGFAGGPAHQQQSASGAPPWSQQSDARGFDLGTYMPAPSQGYQQADAGHHQQDPAVFGGQQQGYAENEQDYDETFGEEEEPPAGRRRGLMIVAALVGAIGLGGGMAYTYKTFFAPRTGPAVVIKDTQGPAKSKPEVADGKGFPHTDKKLLNRLGEDANRPPVAEAPSSTDASGDRLGDDPNGPRRVRTIQIMPGGPSPSPPPVTTATAPPPAGPAPMVGVPGVMLENIGAPRAPAGQRAPLTPSQQAAPPSAARMELPPSAGAPPARAPQPPVRPVTATAMVPPAAMAAPPSPPANPVKAAVPKTKQPAVTTAAAVNTSGGAAGYVAVLSSKKSRMDALKVFADMQQKYGDVLSAKTPDVQEANLGEKGVWYRAVVGPPGSREAAANVCTKLKTAGHDGCWVTAY